MNYVILVIIVMILSTLYDCLKNRMSKYARFFVLAVICLVLCGFAGLRSSYNDTKTYINIFYATPHRFLALFEEPFVIGSAYAYKLFGWIVYHFISTDYHIYFALASALFVVPTVFIINKYSEHFTFSMILLMTSGLYLFSLAALRQSIAIGILALAADAWAQDKNRRFVLLVLLATSFHLYSVIFIVMLFLKKDKVFDLRMNIACLIVVGIGFGMTQFSTYFVDVVNAMGKEMTAEEITNGSVSVLRVAVYIAPWILTYMSKNPINYYRDKTNNTFVILSILSGAFMVLALFGNPILIGRLPYYFLFGTVVALPFVINRGFNVQSTKILTLATILCYSAYEFYELQLDGAFSRDIFKLMKLW